MKYNSFQHYLFKEKTNKWILIFCAIAIVLKFSVFKYLYPYVGFIHGDSFNYLDSAYKNLDINTYMVGYARFLRLFSVFTNSDTALAAFQYLFLQASALFLVFTIFYFYSPHKITKLILVIFTTFNPLFLYMSNLISSDCFFFSLSLLWFTLLLWIIHKPSTQIIIWHTIVLFIAFTVRYNAMIYPLIALLAFLLSKKPWRRIVASLLPALLLCGSFVFYTASKYKQLTGIWQYSPFSGWQWANNAMYAYRYVDSADRKPVPEKFKHLDNMIRQYFDSTRNVSRFPIEGMLASTYYMWSGGLPLMKYMEKQFPNDSTSSRHKKWAKMGPLYSDYGRYIIRQYPWYYARYFLWPNANKYYAPPVEFLSTFNSGKDSVPPIAQAWFGYKTRKVTTRTADLNVKLLDFYPILAGTMNVIFATSLIGYLIMGGFKQRNPFRKGIILATTVWMLNAGFTIFASSAALRFQAFPVLLFSLFAILLLDQLIMLAVQQERVFPKYSTNNEPVLSSADELLSKQ
jgi:hypothetical protein